MFHEQSVDRDIVPIHHQPILAGIQIPARAVPRGALQIQVRSTSVSLLLILKFTLVRPTPAPPTLAVALPALAAKSARPDLGPHVVIFDPSAVKPNPHRR